MASERDAAKRNLRARVDQFLAGGDRDVVLGPEATALAVEVGRDTTADSSDYLDVIQLLGWFHLCRNRLLAQGAALPDLHATARLLAPIHRTAPQTLPTVLLVTVELLAGLPPYRVPEELAGKAINLMTRGTAGDLASVTKAISLFLEAASAAPVDHPDRAAMLSNACWGWLTVYNLTGDRSAIGHAVRIGEEAVAALKPRETHRAEPLNNLGIALRLRFDQTGDAGDLARAIALLTEAVEHTPHEDVEWGVRNNNLGIALGIRYGHSGRRSDIDRALVALRQAAEATGPRRPERPGFFGDLAYFHWVRFQHAGDRADLDAAAQFFGVAAASPDGQLRQRARAYLEAVQEERAKHDLGRAPPTAAAVVMSPEREAAPDLAALLAQAEDLYQRALATRQVDELAATVPMLRRALAVTPLDHPAGVWCRLSLASALTACFLATADLTALDEAVALLTELARALPRGDEHRKTALVNLSGALTRRFGYLAELADLTLATEMIREALVTDPHDAVLLTNLGNLLVDHHRWSAAPADLDEAVAVGERAVEFAPPQSTYRYAALCNLGKARLERYRLGADPGDLDTAITVLQQALQLLPPDAADRVTILAMLAGAWRDRFTARGDRADIDHAIDAGRFLEQLGPQLPYLAADILTGLGICLRLRADAFDREEDRTEAIAVWQAAAAAPGPAKMRFIAAALAATNQSERGRPAEAVEDYATAVGLLPLLAWRGLDRASREKLLGDYPGVAAQAAASAVAAGDPGRGIELLEQGRSVLWGQLLETRSDLTVLHEVHPELAARLDRLRDMLDLPVGMPVSAGT